MESAPSDSAGIRLVIGMITAILTRAPNAGPDQFCQIISFGHLLPLLYTIQADPVFVPMPVPVSTSLVKNFRVLRIGDLSGNNQTNMTIRRNSSKVTVALARSVCHPSPFPYGSVQ
jgi:hypothetical protein